MVAKRLLQVDFLELPQVELRKFYLEEM
jgi:hypothetical protein